jgi:hypothetical protein
MGKASCGVYYLRGRRPRLPVVNWPRGRPGGLPPNKSRMGVLTRIEVWIRINPFWRIKHTCLRIIIFVWLSREQVIHAHEFLVVGRRNSYGIYRHIGRDDELKRCG